MLRKNLALATIVTAPSPATSGTSLVVTTGEAARFPVPATDGDFYATLFPPNEIPHIGNAEIVKVTAVSTDTFTIVRAQRGSTAKTVEAGWLMIQGIYGEDLMSIQTGWVEIPETLTRTGNFTFTVPGDLTSVFRKGTKFRVTQTTLKYGVVAGSSESGGTTTVTLITNNDFTLAAAAMESPAVSYIENPLGYPNEFNFAFSSITASGSMTVSSVGYSYAKWKVSGNTITLTFRIGITLGGSASNSVSLNDPPIAQSYGINIVAASGVWLGDGFLVTYNVTTAGPITVNKFDSSNFTLGDNRGPVGRVSYEF